MNGPDGHDQADLAVRLRRLDACAVSDAIDRLGHGGGVVLGLRQLGAPARFAGRAVTVRLVDAEAGTSTGRHLGTTAIEGAEVGDVIVIEHGAREDAAGWGGLLSLAASQRGIAGVVVDGAVRDVDEARELGFAVAARSAVPLTARGRVIEQSTNEAVELAGVTVEPGDLVLVDGSGVVVVAAGTADEVIGAAEKIVAREARMADDIRGGAPVSEVLGKDYETMLGTDGPAP